MKILKSIYLDSEIISKLEKKCYKEKISVNKYISELIVNHLSNKSNQKKHEVKK